MVIKESEVEFGFSVVVFLGIFNKVVCVVVFREGGDGMVFVGRLSF